MCQLFSSFWGFLLVVVGRSAYTRVGSSSSGTVAEVTGFLNIQACVCEGFFPLNDHGEIEAIRLQLSLCFMFPEYGL